MLSEQSNPLRKVGECLYRNGHGVYFAWFSVRGKQLKRSLKTSDKELARRRLGELRKIAARLHGLEDRNLRFEEVVKAWLESIEGSNDRMFLPPKHRHPCAQAGWRWPVPTVTVIWPSVRAIF